MKNYILGVALVLVCCGDLRGEEAPPKTTPEINQARQHGWQMAAVAIGTLQSVDQSEFTGIEAWLKDYAEVAKGIDEKAPADGWPALDIDALTVHNPRFWQAYYQIAPGDHGLTLIQAGLLLSAGEAIRASHILAAGWQRPGMPKEVDKVFRISLAHTNRMRTKPNEIVGEGIKLHDKGDYAGALAKYEEALALWPQNGFAHYEVGYARYFQQLTAAGKPLPEAGKVILEGGEKQSPEVLAAYALARRHDPFQFNAYQGDDPAVIASFMALAKKGMPAWQKMSRKVDVPVDDEVLKTLAAACQEAGIHELALAIRQVLIARRGGYAPEDHPFISVSLRKLAPGETTEETLKTLAAPQIKLRALVVPEPAKP